MKTLNITLKIMAICSFLLLSCNEKSDKAGLIKIGAVVPLTGEVATYGASLKKGFEMAVAENNQKFSIIYEDSKADKNTGISGMNKLISSDNVKFVLGDATSGVTLAIAPIAEKNKIILLDPIATSDAIIKSGDFVFSNAPSNYRQAIKAAAFITDNLKLKDIAIIYNQTDYGVNLSQRFKDELKKQNIKPLYEAGYQDGTSDFKTILIRLKGSNAKAVFVPGNYEETANMLKQAKQLDINIPFIGTDGAYSPKLIEIAGNATSNFYLTMMGVDSKNALYKKFVQSYIQKYNESPDVFTCYGYEAAQILFQAISKAGNDPIKVKQLFYETTFDSFSGPLKFDSNGSVIRDYVILRIINGKFSN